MKQEINKRLAVFLLTCFVGMTGWLLSPVCSAATLAQRPTMTDVVIHSVTDFSSKAAINRAMYWGNGTENGFSEAVARYDADTNYESDWRVSEGNTYRALRIPDDVVHLHIDKNGHESTPTVSKTVLGTLSGGVTPDGKEKVIRWSDVLLPVKVDQQYGGTYTVKNYDAGENTTSAYTIQYQDYNGQASVAYITALRTIIRTFVVDYWQKHALSENQVRIISEPTDKNGQTHLHLANGQWIIFQTLRENENPDLQSTLSVPIFLNLPMLNPMATSIKDQHYYFDNAATPLHIYAKQYDPAEVKVTKKNANDGSSMAGAQFLMVRVSDWQNNLVGLNQLIKQVIPEINADPKHSKQIMTKYLGSFVGPKGNPLWSIASTDKSGVALFTSENTEGYNVPEAGEKYYISEIHAPDGYMVDMIHSSDSVSGYEDIHEVECQKIRDPNGGYETSAIIGVGATEFQDFDVPTVDKAVKVNDRTFGLHQANSGDDSEGVARGNNFQWLINTEINRNIETWSQFDLFDTTPYATNWSDMQVALTYRDAKNVLQRIPLYAIEQHFFQRDATGIAHLEHATGHGLFYSTNPAGAVVNGQYIPYVPEVAPTIKPLDSSLPSDATVEISGKTSYYQMTTDGRTIDTAHKPENGFALMRTNGALRQWLSAKMYQLLADGIQPDSCQLEWTIDAFANTAAQAGDLVNSVELRYATEYEHGVDTDRTHTFVAGWEIAKTNGTPKISHQRIVNGLAGAGFNLAYRVTPKNLTTIIANCYDAQHYPNYQNTASLSELEQLKKDVLAGKPRWVYFMHLDVKNEQPMVNMTTTDHDAMGDVIWTLKSENATTHLSGQDGYLQYCGLASGDYELIETTAPLVFSE
ncbi:hypothetical protein H9L19_02645 [Weissella diestrammenae]|uniref:Prealbumin-like fold domain-containing protein n=1 Tax=Weissella diestrammenae TaxID=1162633 RepID=A0A7G9T6Q5_9LACO|nr:hypothetical protein [Weissella diestrammenae]QNN75780.1 hypothetical protein H9L19_02645 [Weissella diestrammenae]